MLVEVSYAGADRAGDLDAYDYRFHLLDWRTQERVRVVIFRVDSLTRVRFSMSLGNGDKTLGAPLFQAAMLRVCVQRILAAGAGVLDAPETPMLTEVTGNDIEMALAGRKQCDHQERRGGELFCLAAERTPPAAGVPDDRRGCTTLHACQTLCKLPDTTVLCSGFVHLQVYMAALYPPAPVVGSRICEKGRQAQIQKDPVECVPGGHDCWYRIIDLTPTPSTERLPALALHEAVDFLCVVWKQRFSTAKRLLDPGGVSGLGEIAQQCATSEEFRSRMNAFKDLVDSLTVDPALITETVPVDGNRQLRELRNALKSQLPEADFERAALAVMTLQRIVDIRNGLHHADAAPKIPVAAATLGLAWPPRSWGGAWSHVRDTAARAVTEIRKVISA
jgi:hypothetical protein